MSCSTYVFARFFVLYAAFGTGLFSQTVVQVPGTAQIFLAARNDGTFVGNDLGRDTAPANSPAAADLRLLPGQALQISATGSVRLFGGSVASSTVNPNGSNTEFWLPRTPSLCFTSQACIGEILARRGALIGVFVGEPKLGDRVAANFVSAAELDVVQEPLTWQPFLIGEGRTSEGTLRKFVVPQGATKLYLGVLGLPVSGNSGSFQATITEVNPPDAAGSTNPVRVPGNRTVLLTAATPGFRCDSDQICDFAPLNSPIAVNLKRLGAHVVQIAATGQVSVEPGAEHISPSGLIGNYVDFGFRFSTDKITNNIRAPLGSLVGVFTMDQWNTELNDGRTADYSAAAQRDVLERAPAVQQFFYIGSGRTTAGAWKRYAVPQGATWLYLGVMDGTSPRWANDNTGWFFVSVTPDTGQEPAISPGANGVVNGASYDPPPLSAGSFATIFGDRLAAGSDSASAVPLPTTLANSKVWINGIPAPLYFASPKQINLQIPTALEGETEGQVLVSNGAVPGVPAVILIAPFRPGIFLYGDSKPVIVNASSGKLATENDAVRPGDTLVIYATGLGPVSPPAVTGEPASLTVLSRLNQPVSVLIGNVSHQPAFTGLAPGMIGVFQINVQLLPSIGVGAQKLQIVSGNSKSNAVDVTVSK